MTTWIYPDAFSSPVDAAAFDDLDAEWTDALSYPKDMTGDDKRRCPAVCGAEFAAGTTSRDESPTNLLAIHALILDVDVWRPDRPPFTLDEIVAHLDGVRFIAWTTFSSTAELRRWRVVIPLAAPMPPRRFHALWTWFNEILDKTMATTTCTPGRFGFLGGVGSEAGLKDYQFHIHGGSRLDWTQLDLVESETTVSRRALSPVDMSRGSDWATDDQALDSAKRYYRHVGEDVEVGSRHDTLLRASCRLWWDWAAPDDKFVRDVLERINANFPEAKTEAEVELEVQAGHDRVFGLSRVDQPASYGAEREPTARATATGLADAAKSLRRHNQDSARGAGRALAGLARGEAYSEPAESRALLLQAAEAAAQAYPFEKPERMLELLKPGIEAQRARNGILQSLPTDEEVLTKIRFVQTSHRKRAEERARALKNNLTRQISAATKGKRDTPYTAREIRAWESRGLTESRWIMAHGSSFYVWVEGEYIGPVVRSLALEAVGMYLSPAYEHLRLSCVNKDGIPRPRPLGELLVDYGTIVNNIERSVRVARGELDETRGVLMLPAARVRDLQPQHSSAVEGWLQALAGTKYEALCQWLVTASYPDRPCAALVLCTGENSGKHLLACALARLWTTGPLPRLHSYTPDQFEDCPLVFCDEQLPPGWRRRPGPALCELLSEESHRAHRMYQDPYAVLVYPRLIFAGSSVNVLAGVEKDSDPAEARALVERILYIDRAGSAARRVLESYSTVARTAFVDDDVLARHVLWLRDRYKPDPSKRFGAGGADDQFMRAFLVGREDTSQVLDWVFSFVSSKTYSAPAVVAKDGKLYARSTTMAATWRAFDATRVPMKTRLLGIALAASGPRRAKLEFVGRDGAVSRAWYRAVDMDLFVAWMKQAQADVASFAEDMLRLEAKYPFKVVHVQDTDEDTDNGTDSDTDDPPAPAC